MWEMLLEKGVWRVKSVVGSRKSQQSAVRKSAVSSQAVGSQQSAVSSQQSAVSSQEVRKSAVRKTVG